jgi:hypothetical protein
VPPTSPRVDQVDFCFGPALEDVEWCLDIAAEVHAIGGRFMLTTRWSLPVMFEVTLPASLLPLPEHLRDVAEVYRAAIDRPDRFWAVIQEALGKMRFTPSEDSPPERVVLGSRTVPPRHSPTAPPAFVQDRAERSRTPSLGVLHRGNLFR